MAIGWLWCRWRRFDTLALADSAALTLPLIQVVTCLGLLLSGESFGMRTELPWGIPLFGSMRHPTQIYMAIAALTSYVVIERLARRPRLTGDLLATYLGLQGGSFLLIEAVRADSLVLPYGIRSAQVVGLGLLLTAIIWLRNLSQSYISMEGHDDMSELTTGSHKEVNEFAA